VYSSAVFTGLDLFAFKFFLDTVVPINHSWHQKTRGTGLSDGEDCIPLCSLVLTQYRSVMDRQTDRTQTDVPPVAHTLLAKIALQCAIKMTD